MQKKAAGLVLLALLCGCATRPPIMERLTAYQAFPVEATTLEQREYYVKITFPPLSLFWHEEGSAWLLLVRLANGELLEPYPVAVQTPTRELVAILPQDLEFLEGALAVVVSHDALFCYNAQGEESFCSDLDSYDWQAHATPLTASEQVCVVQANSPEDEEIEEWFRQIAANEMAQRFGTTLTEAIYQAIQESENGSYLLTLIRMALPSGVLFASLYGVTNSWQTALTGAGLSLLTPILQLLVSAFTPDLEHPEYGAGHATNRSVGRRLEQLYGAITARYRQLADAVASALAQTTAENLTLRQEAEVLAEKVREMEELIRSLGLPSPSR